PNAVAATRSDFRSEISLLNLSSTHVSTRSSAASDSRPSRSGTRRIRVFLLCAVPAVLAGLVYLHALHNPFAWGDFRVVANNRSLESLTHVRAIALHEVSRPLVNLSYAIDRAIWGAGTFGFHLSSVLLHVFNVVLLFQLARRLVADAQTGRDRSFV